MGSLNHEQNEMIRQIDPSIPTRADWVDLAKTVAYLWAGLLPYMDVPYDSLPAAFLTRETLGLFLYNRGNSFWG